MDKRLTPEQVLKGFNNAKPATQEQWNEFIRCINNQLLCIPVSVIPRYDGDPYKDYEEMKRSIEDNEILYISTLGDVPSGHPLKGTNIIFRAVHDYFGHYLTDSDFSWDGEYTAYLHHKKMFPKSVWGILAAETMGQAAYRIVNGEFPIQQPVQMEPV